MKQNRSRRSQGTMTFMSDAREWMGELAERIREIVGPIQEALKPIRTLIESPELHRLVEAWPGILRRFATLSEAMRDACARAALPPFRLMDMDEWKEVERVSQSDGALAAADLVAARARAALADPDVRAELVRDWRANPLSARRVDILEQGLRAHELGLFAVSIPPFLAHVEGVIADSEHSPQEKRNPRFDQLKEYIAALDEKDEYMGGVISEYVIETVYKGFVRTKDAPLLSRHAILHGFDTGYPSEMNSVRAILIFDCVQDLTLGS